MYYIIPVKEDLRTCAYICVHKEKRENSKDILRFIKQN